MCHGASIVVSEATDPAPLARPGVSHCNQRWVERVSSTGKRRRELSDAASTRGDRMVKAERQTGSPSRGSAATESPETSRPVPCSTGHAGMRAVS